VIPMIPGTKVYLACQPVSMRLGFDGLAAHVAQVLDGDPFICVGHSYVAAGQKKRLIPR
jgi:transposase